MRKILFILSFSFLFVLSALAQNMTVKGRVTGDDDGQPVSGASVRVKGNTKIGVSTNAQGEFTLSVPTSSKVLVISGVGFFAKEVPVSKDMSIVLQVDASSLDEVVVTAGGINLAKRQQGNQATTVKAQELTQAKAYNVASALTGKVAGLQVNAVSAGVNPNIRLVLRGNRSLLGNNQALVVLDNVIVPSSVLGNLNPEDIETVEVLNGAGAAALYGSDASNGALIITTKKGKAGITNINVSQTTTFESVAFLPQLQTRFGSGTGPDDAPVPGYTPYENQQYGDAYDGSMRPIGKPLVDGSIQSVPYSYNTTEGRDNFWETGLSNQTDISVSTGDDKSTLYLSGQYFTQTATIPGDKYNRFSLRLNGDRKLGDQFLFSYNVGYVQNRYNLSTASGTAFENVLMTPGQVPLTRYSDWKTDPYASPNGYFNEYYPNPYFTLANNRSLTRNDYLTGLATLKWQVLPELSFLFRTGISARNFSSKSWTNQFTYSPYRLSITSNFQNILGGVNDGAGYETQISPEFIAQYIKDLNQDFSLNAVAGFSARDNMSKGVGVSSVSMVVPDLFNISNTTQNPGASESNFRVRQMGVFGQARFGFKKYLYVNGTVRNDWRSVLSEKNRSIFYPAVDVSFIASDAIPALKKSNFIQVLKIRGGVSKVGQVNIDPYALAPTFGQQYGYPYNNVPGYGVGNRIVSDDIKPELTISKEAGIDFEILKSRITGSFSLYKSNTKDQTVPAQISTSSGYSSFLTNVGEVQNTGMETALRVFPVKNDKLIVSIGANYTKNINKVLSLSEGKDLSLFSLGAAQIIAREGLPFPYLVGTTYNRDDQGRVIVDRITGMPSNSTLQIGLGQTEPTHRLGMDASVEYKGLRFATVLEYRQGNVIYSGASTGFDFSGAGIRTTYFNRQRFVMPNSSYLDPATNTYVANTNITTRTGGVDFWTNGPTNTNIVENYTYAASFWKMREMSLTYDLPAKLFNNVKQIKGVKIGLQGRNLFLWTPKTNIYTDPEYSAAGATNNAIGTTNLSQTPPGRYYGFNVSVSL